MRWRTSGHRLASERSDYVWYSPPGNFNAYYYLVTSNVRRPMLMDVALPADLCTNEPRYKKK